VFFCAQEDVENQVALRGALQSGVLDVTVKNLFLFIHKVSGPTNLWKRGLFKVNTF
jgi:hypothetical protein